MMRGLTLGSAIALAFFLMPEASLRAFVAEDPVPVEVAAKKNPVPLSDGVLAKARKNYADNCAQCHGDGGKGDGPMAGMLKERPADLSDGKVMVRVTDGEIYWYASKGKPPVMPAFESKLTEEERWGLVYVLRELSKTEPNNKPRGGK